MKELKDVERQLRDAKCDTENPLAVVNQVYPDRRDSVDAAPSGPDNDYGLVVKFERPSGAVMTRWYAIPETWEDHHDLVILLSYMNWSPDDGSETLQALEEKQVPVRHIDGGWQLDWGVISDDSETPGKTFH